MFYDSPFWGNPVWLAVLIMWSCAVGWVLYKIRQPKGRATTFGPEESAILVYMFGKHPLRVRFVSIAHVTEADRDPNRPRVISVGLDAVLTLKDLGMIQVVDVVEKDSLHFEAGLTMRGVRYMARQKGVSKPLLMPSVEFTEVSRPLDIKTIE